MDTVETVSRIKRTFLVGLLLVSAVPIVAFFLPQVDPMDAQVRGKLRALPISQMLWNHVELGAPDNSVPIGGDFRDITNEFNAAWRAFAVEFDRSDRVNEAGEYCDGYLRPIRVERRFDGHRTVTFRLTSSGANGRFQNGKGDDVEVS
jgi:hypothetical protein